MNKEEKKAIKSMKRFVECRQDMTAVTASEMKIVLDLLEKKDKIIYEIAKSNVKLKGYDVEETYINNTISFYTKYIENLERNPHWREESRKWKLKLKIM